jgi:hypothetical protein
MLNLHAPFRRAEERDLGLSAGSAKVVPGRTVLAEEAGRVVALLDGEEDGEAWRVTALFVAESRLDELGRRILAVADALAADDGLVNVTLDPASLGDAWRVLLDQEGFRPTGEGGWLARPVVPQG